MEIDVRLSVNRELFHDPSHIKSTRVASGWVEINHAFRFAVQVLANRDNKMFVKYPARKTADGTYSNVVFPNDKEIRGQIDERVIAEVHKEIAAEYEYDSQKITDVDVTVLPEEKMYGNMSIKGYASLEIEGIRINGLAIKESASGLFVQMPQYRDADGQYHDQFYGLHNGIRNAINRSVLDAYNTKTMEPEKGRIIAVSNNLTPKSPKL